MNLHLINHKSYLIRLTIRIDAEESNAQELERRISGRRLHADIDHGVGHYRQRVRVDVRLESARHDRRVLRVGVLETVK